MLGPRAEDEKAVPPLAFGRKLRPKLLGDEGHEGMKQRERPVEHPAGHGARLRCRGLIGTREDRLDQFEIPVAELMPDETVNGAGGLVEPIGLERLGYCRERALALACDPAVERLLRGGRI